MCKRVIYRVLFALCRTLLKRRMMTNMPKIDEGLHPAVSCVRNFMSGSDDCLVLWGLRQSDTRLCARAIAQGVIREKGLAKLFCCELIPEDFTLQKFFLSASSATRWRISSHFCPRISHRITRGSSSMLSTSCGRERFLSYKN